MDKVNSLTEIFYYFYNIVPGLAPKEPVQSVMPLYGLELIERSFLKLSISVIILGSPKTGQGGSSGCTARHTPLSSAAGTTLSRKRA